MSYTRVPLQRYQTLSQENAEQTSNNFDWKSQR